MFEFTPGRFINPARIIGASAYEKEGQWSVAIDLDVTSADKKAVYAKGFADYNAAVSFINRIPVLQPA